MTKMRLVTTRTQIREVAARWFRTYSDYINGVYGLHQESIHSSVHKKLLALNRETATPKQVAEIIDNPSWTRVSCSFCSRRVTRVVELTGAFDGGVTCICEHCVAKINCLLKGKS